MQSSEFLLATCTICFIFADTGFSLIWGHWKDVFVHFEPMGYTLRHYEESSPHGRSEEENLQGLYEQALSAGLRALELENDGKSSSLELRRFPHYIEEGSVEAKRWIQTHSRTKLVRFSSRVCCHHYYSFRHPIEIAVLTFTKLFSKSLAAVHR